MLLRDLSWLLVVAELEHVTAASEVIKTSQPTLSRAIARIEVEVGTRIFERVADGVRLTPSGELVIAAAKDITSRHDQMRADLESILDPESGLVRLAFLDSMGTSLVPELLRQFHAHSPRTRVQLSQAPAHDIVADLASSTVDLAITSAPPSDEHGWQPLQEERLVLVVPEHHRLWGRRRIDLSDIGDEELITTPVGFGYRVLVDALLRDAGVSPVVSFESQHLGTIEGLVAAGLGVAILPEQFAGQSGTQGIPISGAVARRLIGLTWRTDKPLPPPATRFRDFVVKSVFHTEKSTPWASGSWPE